MDSTIASLLPLYEWQLALKVVITSFLILTVGHYLLYLLPGLKETKKLNRTTARQRMAHDFYMRIQIRSGAVGMGLLLLYVVLVLPFILTTQSKPLWRTAVDIFSILMVYDFFYYLSHRFLFHASALGAPLRWMHAVHHQQKNPCRLDSNYLHPLETFIGLALMFSTITGLAFLMGGFEVITIVVAYVLLIGINQLNHDLMEVDRFPFQWMHHYSYLHHVHHARFTGGNFGTISPFFDWLFGTYDTGKGWGNRNK